MNVNDGLAGSDVEDLKYGDERHMLLLALDAFEAALQRWERVSSDLDEAVAFAPLAEALWWAVSVDERMHAVEGTTYRARRDKDSDGRLVPGIVWARNRTGHDQALVLRYQPGAELGRLLLGVSRLGTRSELVWREASALPIGRSDFGRDVYVKHLERRGVANTVTALRRWFQGRLRSEGPLKFDPPKRADPG